MEFKIGACVGGFSWPHRLCFFRVLQPDGERLLTVSDDKTARIWNASTGEELLTLGHSDWVWNAAFSPNGQRVATLSQDKAVIWSAVTAEKKIHT
ncbi:MAG: hypothetical protein IPJ46_10535 [Anaerolineales bacterium]|nr:hypothetical protein [Anaerolineales bacterium]